jgi:hypothetical protein
MPRAETWVIGLAWALAAVNLAAAAGKLLDLHGFVALLAEYRLAPAALLMPMAVLVVALEILAGIGLLVLSWRRRAALVAAALATVNGIVLTVTLLRGIQLANCGCFGVYLARPLTILSPLEDVALLVAALLVARRSA